MVLLRLGERLMAKSKLTEQDKKDLAKLDMSRADRFVWQDGDITVTPATPEERARIKEMYKDVDWSALTVDEGDDEEEKSAPSDDLESLPQRFEGQGD
jgi:hypothetical protein